MILQKASRKRAKIKMQVGGSAGAGKTYSSLLIAYGLCGDWNKIAVIDTENESANLYADLGEYFTINVTDYSPESYVKAIEMCEEAGIEVVIIDSSTHCWEWCNDYNSKMSGNSFQNWGITMKKFNKFKNKLLQAPMHIISTVRKKEEYAMEKDANGKTLIVKKGLKEIQKGEMTYEFTIVLDIDSDHTCTSSKDRTNLFVDAEPFMVTVETGQKILNWCNSGAVMDKEAMLREALILINSADSIEELKSIILKNQELKKIQDFVTAVTEKQKELTNNA